MISSFTNRWIGHLIECSRIGRRILARPHVCPNLGHRPNEGAPTSFDRLVKEQIFEYSIKRSIQWLVKENSTEDWKSSKSTDPTGSASAPPVLGECCVDAGRLYPGGGCWSRFRLASGPRRGASIHVSWSNLWRKKSCGSTDFYGCCLNIW